jgi:type II secretory pathway pseudopilin PulG
MNKKGQVWVETVIYTLIALVIIGLVLSYIQPKIMELQDKATLQESMSMLNNVNNVLLSLADNGVGNTRKLQISLTSGTLTIDGSKGIITFSMDNSHDQFSEPGQSVNYGNIVVYTKKENNLNIVNMTINYGQEYNITYSGGNIIKTITHSSTPYNLLISNNGGNPTNMDFSLV